MHQVKLSFTVLRVDRESFSLFKLHLFNKQKSHFLARTRVVQYSLSFYGIWQNFTPLLGVPLFITTPFSRRKKVSWVCYPRLWTHSYKWGPNSWATCPGTWDGWGGLNPFLNTLSPKIMSGNLGNGHVSQKHGFISNASRNSGQEYELPLLILLPDKSGRNVCCIFVLWEPLCRDCQFILWQSSCQLVGLKPSGGRGAHLHTLGFLIKMTKCFLHQEYKMKKSPNMQNTLN